MLASQPLDLQEIPAGSPLLRLPHVPCSVCPVADTNAPLPSRLAKTLRQQLRYLEAEGHVGFTTSDSPSLLGPLLELHAARLGSQRPERPAVRPELRLLPLACRSTTGWLRLASYPHSFRRQPLHRSAVRTGSGRYHALLPEWLRSCLGALQSWIAADPVRDGIRSGAGDSHFDFLRGAEAYKYRWGATDRPQYRIYT